MAITNEEALKELADIKGRESQSPSSCEYWHGVLIGTAGAYMRTDVITLKQFLEITKPEVQTA